MATPDDPPIPNEPDDGLDVEDLDFTRHDEVEDLGNGRYLIETDGPMASADDEITESGFAGEDADDISTVYAVHADIIAGEDRSELSVTSDDVVEAFEELLEGYAETVSSDIPPEDTLELLLSESQYGD